MKASTNGVLEFLRLSVATLVSYLLTEGVVDFLIVQIFGVILDPIYKTQITILITFVLKSIDRYLHEKGGETRDTGYLGKKGIIGF